MKSSHFLCIVILAVIIQHCFSASWGKYSDDYYQIDWSRVPSSAISLVSESSTTFGSCSCSLTVGQCENNCCCDGQCTNSQKTQFTYCSSQTLNPKYQTIRCISPSWLLTFNALRAPYEHWLSATPFCVAIENGVTNGQYFGSVSDISASDVANAATTEQKAVYKKEIAFSSVFDSRSVVTTTTDHSWKNSDLLLIGRGSSVLDENMNTLYPKYFQAFGPSAFSSVCTSTSYAKYLTSVPARKCVREVTQTSCGSEFSYQTLFEKTFFRQYKNPYNATYPEYLPIQVLSVVKQEVDSNGVVTTAGTFHNSFTTGFDSATQYCNNSVVGAEYIISSSFDGVLTAIYVKATVQDLKVNAFYPTSFSLTFLENSANYTTLQTGEIRKQSGSPGYQRGQPVLSGILYTQNSLSAIYQSVSALYVYSGLSCSEKKKKSVIFNRNMVSACKMTLTLQELQDLCLNSQTTPISALTETSTQSHVGRYGNADLYQTNQWVGINTDTTKPQATWDSVAKSCKNLGSVMEYQFVIAKAGNINNPQWKIVGVRRFFSGQNWNFDNSATTTDFWVQWRVRFIESPSQYSYVSINPVPTLLPTLPDDVLYPL